MSNDDYSKKQAKRDAEYQRDYEAWVQSMSLAERREAEKLGLLKPCIQRHGNGAAEHDMADSSAASYTPDIAALVDHEDNEQDEPNSRIGMKAATRILRYLVADVIAEGNSRLTIDCLAVALGLSAYNGQSMTEIAKRHGITRAAVSKRCVDITKRLNLLPSRAMRTELARKIYRQSQLKRYRSKEET